MKKVVFFVTVVALTGAVGTNVLDEPALGAGPGLVLTPQVNVCGLEGICAASQNMRTDKSRYEASQ